MKVTTYLVPAVGERVTNGRGMPGRVARLEVTVCVELDAAEPGNLELLGWNEVRCPHRNSILYCPDCDRPARPT